MNRKDETKSPFKINGLEGLTKLREILGQVIYLQPHIYKVIVGLGLAVPFDPEKDDYMNYYHVYTKYPHTNKKGLKEIAVTLEVGEAIKVLVKDKPQFMFPKIEKAPFDRVSSVLTINRISFEISRESGRSDLCRILFGNKKNIGKIWSIGEIEEKMSIRHLDQEKRYHHIYDKVRFLNDCIKKTTELEDFVELRDKTIRINPLYTYTFFE